MSEFANRVKKVVVYGTALGAGLFLLAILPGVIGIALDGRQGPAFKVMPDVPRPATPMLELPTAVNRNGAENITTLTPAMTLCRAERKKTLQDRTETSASSVAPSAPGNNGMPEGGVSVGARPTCVQVEADMHTAPIRLPTDNKLKRRD